VKNNNIDKKQFCLFVIVIVIVIVNLYSASSKEAPQK